MFKHPCCDVDSDATDVVSSQLDLARVESGTDLEVEGCEGSSKSEGAPNGTPWTVERSEDAVSGVSDQPSAVLVNNGARHGTVGLHQYGPAAVAENAACSVESTMSVNRIVANARLVSAVGAIPVTNASM